MVRFLADENVSRLVIERLRAGGFDVVAIAETRSGLPDSEVLQAAVADRRVLITEDRDFGELVVRQQLGIQGIILLELDRLSNEREADVVVAMVTAHANKLSGNLIVVEPARVRIRPLSQ